MVRCFFARQRNKHLEPKHIRASFPLFFPGTDIKVQDTEIRVYGSGDDQTMWDVQFLGSDDKWHTAPTAHRKAILAHIEIADPLTWGDILVTANTPNLAA